MERHAVITDWFHAQWLVVAVGIVLLCCLDAFFTIILLSNGAYEANPLMRPLVAGSGHSFAYWKLGLTIGGVVFLTALARMRVFGKTAVGSILYAVLAAYCLLIGYELHLLRNIGAD